MEFNKYKLKELLQVNPKVTLKKGSKAKKIAMENIKEFQKKIDNFTIEEFKSGSKFQNGDTLLARITPCLENGKTAYVDILEDNEIAFGSTEFFVLRAIDNKLNSQFLYYLFRTNKIRDIIIKSMTGTSGRQRAQKESILEYECEIPTIQYQRKIATILKNLDDKIEINKKLIANLDELSQTLFKRWFVDFEFPDENGNPYKSSGGEMIDSVIGEIPKGWKISKLDKIINIKSGKRPRNKVNIVDNKNKIPIIGASKIMGYTSNYLESEPILVMGRVGTHGIIQRFNNNVWPSDNTFIIKSKFMIYTYFILINIDYKSLNRGSTQPLLSQKDIKNINIIIPKSDSLIVKYEEITNIYFKEIDVIKDQISYLIELRDTLLPKLMSGELEIPDDVEVNTDELSI
ncbi:restriction endonuclease subunit S [Staphylococcus caprae]|uniref:restriction endonuclease subunit S n=2 Tax=Staphylococcus TaxID=1279 RepID=UPI000CD1745D|nr:restriction endonuclease subunit S [Staphylococcus caprae]POA07904.1 restriction endonuclease subunit S [Staphylococcus caprae]SUL94267.1 type I restriction-modification system specificity protein [Staphylococcus caprae]